MSEEQTPEFPELEDPKNVINQAAQKLTSLNFVTSWAIVVEGIDEQGEKVTHLVDSDITYAHRMGMFESGYYNDRLAIQSAFEGDE